MDLESNLNAQVFGESRTLAQGQTDLLKGLFARDPFIFVDLVGSNLYPRGTDVGGEPHILLGILDIRT